MTFGALRYNTFTLGPAIIKCWSVFLFVCFCYFFFKTKVKSLDWTIVAQIQSQYQSYQTDKFSKARVLLIVEEWRSSLYMRDYTNNIFAYENQNRTSFKFRFSFSFCLCSIAVERASHIIWEKHFPRFFLTDRLISLLSLSLMLVFFFFFILFVFVWICLLGTYFC